MFMKDPKQAGANTAEAGYPGIPRSIRLKMKSRGYPLP